MNQANLREFLIGMNRRTFMKITGLGSLSFAAGCTSEPEKNLFSLVEAPDDMVIGKASWYAGTCRECPAGCGVLAKNREGRIIKLEGNPLHPVNRGRLCIRGQAALQGIYNPDRIKTPLRKEKGRWIPISFNQAEFLLKERAETAAKRGPDRVRLLTEVEGASLMGLFRESLENWGSEGLVVFEPYAYEALKTANKEIFGVEGLISYRMEEADFLVSFGADFLETWLSPVAYARKFKAMHSIGDGKKGPFFHVGPYQSLTCGNADLWLSCDPGSEAAIAFGLIKEALQSGKGGELPEDILTSLKKFVLPYTNERVVKISGVKPEHYNRLLNHLFRSKKPLVLGTGSVSSGVNNLQTDVAVNLLNLLLDPRLSLFDFENRYRVEIAARRSEVLKFFKDLERDPVELLLLNNVNPVFSLPPGAGVKTALEKDSLFVISFSNFMDETTRLADLILPVGLSGETWGEYEGIGGTVSMLQPVMGSLTGAPGMGDLFLGTAFGRDRPVISFRDYIYAHLLEGAELRDEKDWVKAIRKGLISEKPSTRESSFRYPPPNSVMRLFEGISFPSKSGSFFMAVPSIRFFDGRGSNRPWLCEIPDPITQVAWQTPVLVHPDDLKKKGLKEGDIIGIQSKWGRLEVPVYESDGVRPGSLVMTIGQGHEAYGRYAEGMGLNPLLLLPRGTEPGSGAPIFMADSVSVHRTGRSLKLALTAGSRTQHGRKIALSVHLEDLNQGRPHESAGLTMKNFPLTLPLPEGYDRKRDVYPPHHHKEYRWVMVVDLDKCIGCGACVAACYAENNIGMVGMERIVEEREMSWITIQRYHDPEQMERITFIPMLCQHCDDAPCESVCPVYAPHHSKEGLNNQIYNRCIGTRFCSQNCPYKVRRFNWFDWQWPEPLNLQLNPDVTVRSKGVMEKCSFCIQRIKEAHGKAKDSKRKILDGEIQPACLQTCPTEVFTFGNLLDMESRVRKLVEDRRAYQVMGYLNTKPAVIYLKKVVREI